MRIDRLHIENFKKYANQEFDFHPKFTLLVGDNGSGKTTILDALAISLGLWRKAVPRMRWRNILTEEIRLLPERAGDRTRFNPQFPVSISAQGQIGSHQDLRWAQKRSLKGMDAFNAETWKAAGVIAETVRDAQTQGVPLPVLAYYGAGRAWSATNKRPNLRPDQRKPQQFDAYRNCLDARIYDRKINEWFLFEAVAMNGNREGRPGYRAVKQAVLRCIPDADDLRYDADLKEIVLSIRGYEQPFYNLSAGQRMMLSMVADIAIKAVTLNSYLLGPDLPGASEPWHLLKTTPGVVLIDELDVHLHPKWQRRVATDLKETFPGIQFICTSHSPQVIGEVRPGEVRMLDDRGEPTTPTRTFGIDSDRVLDELMDATSRSQPVKQKLSELASAIDQENFSLSEQLLKQVEDTLGEADPEVAHYRTLISFLRETK
jgi:predicted ATP-binding protein involved in virulence